jgi:hypothetical protein
MNPLAIGHLIGHPIAALAQPRNFSNPPRYQAIGDEPLSACLESSRYKRAYV